MWKATAEIIGFFVITIAMMLLMVVCPFAFMRFGKSQTEPSESLQPTPVAKKPRLRILATAGLTNCATRLSETLPRNPKVPEVTLTGNI